MSVVAGLVTWQWAYVATWLPSFVIVGSMYWRSARSRPGDEFWAPGDFVVACFVGAGGAAAGPIVVAVYIAYRVHPYMPSIVTLTAVGDLVFCSRPRTSREDRLKQQQRRIEELERELDLV